MRKATSVMRSFSQENANPQPVMRRFYKAATFKPHPSPSHPLHKYIIHLDDKSIKTPYMHQLAVPSQMLALLVTAEFNRQGKHMKTGQMPLLSLCRTAVDADFEGHLSEHLKSACMEYLKTDTLLFVDQRYEKQHQNHSTPLINNFSNQFKMKIAPSFSINPPQVQINDNFTKWLQSLSNWQLIGFETMTIWMKSTIAAYSMIDSQHHPQHIQDAAYLQEIVQMKGNGEVQQKIMDRNQIKMMVSCGQILYHFGK